MLGEASDTTFPAENASLASSSPSASSLPARFKLQSKAPPLKELKLSTKFLTLPRQERIDVVTTAWIRLHLTNGSARYTLPHSEDVLNEFTQELNRASEIRSILSAALREQPPLLLARMPYVLRFETTSSIGPAMFP